MDCHDKLELLQNNLLRLGSVAIAFSGGVDSSFLLSVAHQVLGERVLAVTARSATFPEREMKEAQAFAARYRIRHMVIDSNELDIPEFANNPPDRCYLCKRELFGKIAALAREEGIAYVAEGSNKDDLDDYRPGLKAVAELGVLSPLRQAGLTKEEIRLLSREIGLATWDKPSFACLSSRFPYGESITEEKLRMVDRAEEYLIRLGFGQVRVRHHGDTARIELHPGEMARLLDDEVRQGVYDRLRHLGFTYVSLDLKGYRTGSMNEALPPR